MNQPKAYLIQTATELAAIASPVRNQIRLAMEMMGACSISELADFLGRSPESLYYHIERLEQVGLVVRADTRETSSGRTDSVYSLRASRVRVRTALAPEPPRSSLPRGSS